MNTAPATEVVHHENKTSACDVWSTYTMYVAQSGHFFVFCAHSAAVANANNAKKPVLFSSGDRFGNVRP